MGAGVGGVALRTVGVGKWGGTLDSGCDEGKKKGGERKIRGGEMGNV